MSLILDGTTGCPVTTVTGTLPVANGGTGVTTSTGSGAVVLGTSPSISGAVLSTMASSVITSGTSQASTSGTSIDFTGIPSWVKRITVMFNGVSTNGTSHMVARLGTAGTPTTSGYLGTVSLVYPTTATFSESAGFPVYYDTASFLITGSIAIHNISGNIWIASGAGAISVGVSGCWFMGGSISMAGVVNMLRITTVNGTDTFDAGSINILYE